jgi:hypothetical protein
MSARACWLYSNAEDEECDNDTWGRKAEGDRKMVWKKERWGISKKGDSQSDTRRLRGDASKREEKKAIKRDRVTEAYTVVNGNKAREETKIFANRLGGHKIRGERKQTSGQQRGKLSEHAKISDSRGQSIDGPLGIGSTVGREHFHLVAWRVAKGSGRGDRET